MLESITKERVYNNLQQFTSEEQQIILDNINIIKKIYLLGILDSKL